ncbi:Uncharacterized protein Adt_07810 [Abeliophyllum distichum]|uniref:Reverse transcriptase domain-containing protein n=1 Tax=Abeliophyllum distichum TaxID=126358 RepID=A0ABD1VAU1_9LAMI
MWAPPHRRDETKYCKFHRDHGHDTDDCQQLKEEIERLIKRGQLSKFVKADKEKGKEAEYHQQPPPRAGVINVIVGGIAAGGDSNSARKSYARDNRSASVDFDVKRVLVNNGSAADVMSWEVFLGLKISPSKIKPVTTPLHGFGGATVIPEGTIELLVTLGTYPASVVIMTSFLLVKAHMAYNAISGRPLLNAARAVIYTYHQVLKIGGGMDVEEKHKLVACLSKNIDVFAWGPQDIEGISPMIAQHRLAIPLGTKPIKQKKRQFAPERQQAISTEVAKLLEAGFIRKVHYPEWLENVVLVKKPNGE